MVGVVLGAVVEDVETEIPMHTASPIQIYQLNSQLMVNQLGKEVYRYQDMNNLCRRQDSNYSRY
jgi:hypothetical protein